MAPPVEWALISFRGRRERLMPGPGRMDRGEFHRRRHGTLACVSLLKVKWESEPAQSAGDARQSNREREESFHAEQACRAVGAQFRRDVSHRSVGRGAQGGKRGL